MNRNKLHGERCENDVECLLGMCYEGVCQGLAQGESCTATEQCASNYYCNGNVCTAVLTVGNA